MTPDHKTGLFALLMAAALALSCGNLAADSQPATAPSDKAFSELDAKIERAATGRKWSDGSLRLIREFYDSYKAGHRSADWVAAARISASLA